MSDRLAARVRTAWPYLLAWLAGLLLAYGTPVVAWARDALGVEVTEPAVVAGLGLALGYAIYELGGWLEDRAGDGRWPTVARLVGRWLLSLGLPIGPPTYGRPSEDAQATASGPRRE